VVFILTICIFVWMLVYIFAADVILYTGGLLAVLLC
jgi:hypothetical protein